MGMLSENGAFIGMLVTCQRCGVQTFRKQTGYNSVDAAIQNRHSFYDVFEPMPEGWKIVHAANGWLCPNCDKEFNHTMRAFMERGTDNG